MRQFRSYQLAVNLYRCAARLQSKQLPCHLRDQLKRAASSVVLNLAEGYGRLNTGDQGKFYKISLGSAREVQAIFDLIEDDTDLVKLADDVAKNIYCLIRSLR